MRILNLWVKIFTIFLLPNLSNGQHSTKQLILTDGQNGVKSIPYRATDQCMPKMDAKNGKTYALSFRLLSEGGHCDDGLLICYPGTLNRPADSSNFKVKGSFKVVNKKDNLVDQNCSSKMEKEGILAGPTHWRGIKVYTMPNGARTRATMLEASIASSPYNLGDNINQFSIHLGGNGTDLFTMITVNHGKPFIDNEANLQNQFREQLWIGAFLREHTGLWMLGLDLLPSMEQENVKLFIARNSNCAMEASFTQSVDLIDPKEPELPTAAGSSATIDPKKPELLTAGSTNSLTTIAPKLPTTGSTNSPTTEASRSFLINLIEPAKIVINATTDDKLKNITVQLLQSDGDAMGKDGTVVMEFTIGTTEDAKVLLPKTASNVIKNSKLLVGSHKMLLEISIFNYCYAISLNGNRLGGFFWPTRWWKGLPLKKIKSIKLNGQMLLLEDPRVEKLAGDEFKNITFPPVEFSLPINFNGVDEQAFIINATNVTDIVVQLLQSDGDAMGKNDTVVLEFTIGTTEDAKVLLPETAPNVIKGSQLLVGSHQMLLEIYLLKYCYAISLNGNQTGKFFCSKQWWKGNKVTSIKLNGQMLLLEDPRVEKLAGDEFKNISHPPVKLPKRWPIAGFRKNSTFLFRVQLLNPSSGFKITFSNNPRFGRITDQTAFVVEVVDLKRVELSVYYDGKAHPEQATRKDSSFNPGDAYEFFISVSERFYGIRLNGEELFEKYSNSMPFCDDMKFVKVEGDAVLLVEPELHVPPPELKNMLNYGDKVVIDGKVGIDIKTIDVYFTRHSMHCSKIYDVVILMKFDVQTGQIESRHKLHQQNEWQQCATGISRTLYLSPKKPSNLETTYKSLNLEFFIANHIYCGRSDSAAWVYVCPSYAYFEPRTGFTTSIQAWAIDHITVQANGSSIDTLQTRVEKASSGEGQFEYYSNTQELFPLLWKRIQFTQVIKKEGEVDNYSVFVNMTLEGELKSDSEVCINFLNEALEVHKIFGTTVLQIKLHNSMLSFNSFFSWPAQTWLVPEQNQSYTFAMDPKIVQKMHYLFEIRVTNSEFYMKLDGKEMDVNQKVLKYPVDPSIRNIDIQVITVELEEIKLAAGTEVEVKCQPEERCVNHK
ncbi:hypothetical protein GPALN_010778 [Globodera pallida]|nr:hypothetical protein GPALN_010778 [Globodera pallida]